MDSLKVIARIKSDFPAKFGIPRQSGIVEECGGTIIFEPEYRNPDALRGLEGFSHIWLLWGFSEAEVDGWSPTVRPPKLGGNKRMGVFATRSPFRPNSIGLSCVKLKKIELHTPSGPQIHVLGADLLDGTPIYDIKPYLPFTDCRPEATGGFAESIDAEPLQVVIPYNLILSLPQDTVVALRKVLEQDPRPSYQKDPERVYGMEFREYEVKFSVIEGTLTVLDIQKR